MQEPVPILADPRDTTRSRRLPQCSWPLCKNDPRERGTNEENFVFGCEQHRLAIVRLASPGRQVYYCSRFGCHAVAVEILRFVTGLFSWLNGCDEHPLRIDPMLPMELR